MMYEVMEQRNHRVIVAILYYGASALMTDVGTPSLICSSLGHFCPLSDGHVTSTHFEIP